ncbi:MAG TPA: ABC transporter permease [Steroidobacteraceae bacterium]|nr:ABC transporter permease [Steroidobacteraceae bacterium]
MQSSPFENTRWIAAVRGWLASEHSLVYAFAAIWTLGVLVPTIISVLLSVLGARGVHIKWSMSLATYRELLESGRWLVVLRTMGLAAVVSLICLVSGFPFALWLAKRARSKKLIQLIWMSLTIPFFLDPSARTIVWRTVLGSTGLINAALLKLHLINAPIEWLLFSDFSVYLGLIGPYFPNMVMPLYMAILLIDDDLLQASADLGASPAATLRHIVIPLAMPGIVAGTIFTFVPIMGDSVVPAMLGGGKKEYLADAVMSLSTSMNYSGAAALATIILTITAILLPLYWLARNRAAAV